MSKGNVTDRWDVHPGLKVGQVNELTLIAKLKPGGAERMRKLMPEGFTGQRAKNTDRIGSVHDLRFVIFDNDSRVMFMSTYDGDWDPYLNDFANIIPEEIDLLFHELEGYPGVRNPEFKDWLAKNQVTAMAFYSAYPNASVKDVWKALKIKDTLNNLLDATS